MASPAKIAVVDCHHHLWDCDENPHYPWLDAVTSTNAPPELRLPRRYTAADYLRDMAPVELVGSVHVEAGWTRNDPCGETAWLAQQAIAHRCPGAAIAHADLGADDLDDVLARHAGFGLVRGIRMRLAETHRELLAFRIGDNPMTDPRWRRGFARLKPYDFSFELQVSPQIMPDAADLADAFPDTTIVVSHLGFPMDPSLDGQARWRSAIAELARRDNVLVKLSGLAMMGLWSQAQLIADIIDHAVSAFGPQRVMFGTNYPVDLRNLSAATHLARHLEWVQGFSVEEAAAILGGNARRIYRL